MSGCQPASGRGRNHRFGDIGGTPRPGLRAAHLVGVAAAILRARARSEAVLHPRLAQRSVFLAVRKATFEPRRRLAPPTSVQNPSAKSPEHRTPVPAGESSSLRLTPQPSTTRLNSGSGHEIGSFGAIKPQITDRRRRRVHAQARRIAVTLGQLGHGRERIGLRLSRAARSTPCRDG